MLFFGFLFQRFKLELPHEGIAYIDFLLPGICAMTVLLGASQSGIGMIRDIQTGFLTRMLTTPAARHWLLVGKMTADVTRLLIQAVIVCLLGILLGASVQPALWPVLLAITALVLFAVGYASLSCYIALRTRSQESMAAFVHLVNMPLFFTSTALVPARQMPPWLETIALYNPFSLVVNVLREALLFATAGPIFPSMGPLLLLAGLLFWLALSLLRA